MPCHTEHYVVFNLPSVNLIGISSSCIRQQAINSHLLSQSHSGFYRSPLNSPLIISFASGRPPCPKGLPGLWAELRQSALAQSQCEFVLLRPRKKFTQADDKGYCWKKSSYMWEYLNARMKSVFFYYYYFLPETQNNCKNQRCWMICFHTCSCFLQMPVCPLIPGTLKSIIKEVLGGQERERD